MYLIISHKWKMSTIREII